MDRILSLDRTGYVADALREHKRLVISLLMMQRLLPALLMVWIDHGADEDWGPLCYPPMRSVH